MKKQVPQAVSSAILKQNTLLKNTWVIVVVVGIPRDVMPHLENILLESSGVTGISDTNRTDKSGRWNILVKELDFKSIRKQFSSKLQEWIRALPSDIQATIPDSFPPPKVHQKNGYEDDDDDDDSSYGQVSYMSSCAQSYASFDDNDADEQYYHPPGVFRHTSYAAAVSGIQEPFLGYGGIGLPKPIPQQEPPSNIEITEFRSTIANLKHDVTIAQLQAEIQNLQAQLKGALTPSTVTETSIPTPNTRDSDRMAVIEANMSSMTAEFTKWMAEVRQIVKPTGSIDTGTKHPMDDNTVTQQFKRADTRTITPNRTEFPIFDPMDTTDNSRVQLFQEAPVDSTSAAKAGKHIVTTPPLSPGPTTQPSHPETPPRTHYDSKRARSLEMELHRVLLRHCH
jgi:hypothetical protein